MNKLTRRKFLKTGMASSLLVGSGGVAGTTFASNPGLNTAAGKSARAALTESDWATIGVAMAVLIPAADGMPSALDVGGIDYLKQVAGELRDLEGQIKRVSTSLDKLSEGRFRKSFSTLEPNQRIEMLKQFEAASETTSLFVTLRDFTYESYYTNPKVWKLLGYDFHPTNQGGPEMKPFGENILTNIRKKPKYFREPNA